MSDDWRDRAACRHPAVRPQDFSPLDGRGRVDLDRARAVAKQVCGPCPVRADCLAAARQLVAARQAPQGLVWAGLYFPVAPTGQPARPGPPIDLFVTDNPTSARTAQESAA